MDQPAFVTGAALPSATRSYQKASICMTAAKESVPKVQAKPAKSLASTATWAQVFLPDFGRKGPGSRPNWDLRPKSLRTVEEGSGICDSCEGSGVMTCSFCLGTPFKNEHGVVEPCPACGGEVTVTCSACFGSSKQIEPVGNWWTEGIAALFNDE